MAKYMLIMRASEDMSAFEGLDFDQILEQVGRFNDELIRAGVLLAAEGLDPDPSESIVVDFTGETPVVTDGPYGETKELFNGYYVLDVATKQEAAEWAKRMPLTDGSRIEVRRVTTIDEFPADNEWIAKERAWRESTGQL
ncbi:hypothetical protein CLV56_3847 [Mumia flava]|uniref:YCII-related domain-containing protein n=1 Tax=Mumia flava TaxID=1348852 RepID=A0A0B2B5X5_9ACTN|nr:YciI family protein [Mumia flava]PJJ54338.1 hypothetical protein CLV56_3847 [Mumia flava]